MKNHLTNQPTQKLLRSSAVRSALFIIVFLAGIVPLRAQVLGRWNFNGNNNGVAGLLTLLTTADFSPAIPARDFNSSVYYGEGGWPSGPLSLSHYFEFGMAPVIGNSLNLSTVSLTIRRSSTGTPSGSGPTRFSVRSSIDGYTSDVINGVLTPAAHTFTFSPGSSFVSLITGVRFRVYGYQSVVSSGGLSRLVMEDLEVNGIGTILPARILNFGAMLRGKTVQVRYGITNNEPGTSFTIERSANGTDYKSIDQSQGVAGSDDFEYAFDDDLAPIAGQLVYYRLKIRFSTGQSLYSNVSAVHLTNVIPARLTLIQQGSTIVVRPTITGAKELSVYTSGGVLLHKAMATPGNNAISAGLPQHAPGIYFIKIIAGDKTESSTVFLK